MMTTSRRGFMQQAGFLGAGLFLNPLPGLSHMLKDKPLNIGMIGCGDRGNGVMSVMKSLPEIYDVNAYCDVLDFRLKNAEQIVGVTAKAFKDYRKLLEEKSIEAVFIAVPLNKHFEVARAALMAGKHVYLEKTMTFKQEEAVELVKLVKAHPKQIFQVGYQYRYSPLYFKVKDMITNNYLGKVTQIDCRWDRNGNWRRAVPQPDLERQVNWRMYREYSGGLTAELLSHQMDFINWAFDTHPDEVTSTGGIDIFPDGRETYDNVQVMLRYKEKGMIGNFGATCGNAWDGYLFKIKGSRGTVSLLTDRGIYYPEKEAKEELSTVDGVTGATKIVWNNDGGTPILQEPTKDGTWYALQEFYKSVRTGGEPASNVHTGARASICVAMANDALYNKRINFWDESVQLDRRS